MPANSATATGLATRYATALFDLAREQNILDAVAADLDGLAVSLNESEAFRRLVASPLLSRDELRRAVTALAQQQGVSELVRNFLGVLAANRRVNALATIIDAFRSQLAIERGEVEAEVTSALPLSEDQLATVRADVERFAARKVRLKHEVDPALLGGLVVRIGSRMIDASLRNKLQQLELSMRGLG